MRSRLCFTVLALLAASTAGSSAVNAEGSMAFRVIVNPDTPAESIDRRFLADAFLKKVTRWPSDELIRPVDLGPESAVRRRFSNDVLSRSVGAIKSYWQQMVFSGRGVPPPELDSDGDVVRFVLRNRGAVGYVSASGDVAGAKIISVR